MSSCKDLALFIIHLTDYFGDAIFIMDHNYYVYIITNAKNGTLYTGMTNNLQVRMYQHKNKQIDGFANKYNCTKLVYFEHCTDVYAVIEREKEIKNWLRQKKIDFIEADNSKWDDLSKEW